MDLADLAQFRGEYIHNTDDKSRLTIPSTFAQIFEQRITNQIMLTYLQGFSYDAQKDSDVHLNPAMKKLIELNSKRMILHEHHDEPRRYALTTELEGAIEHYQPLDSLYIHGQNRIILPILKRTPVHIFGKGRYIQLHYTDNK